jgi:hypothetical protein
MASPVDPNDVLMTGENSFIRFSPDGGKTQTDRASHWRVLWCPARAARIALNGRVAAGTPWMEKRGERDSTSACLAWSETWVKPR